MPIYGPEEKCPHGVQLGKECEPCQELVRKYVVPRKDFGPFKINKGPQFVDPVPGESEEKTR